MRLQKIVVLIFTLAGFSLRLHYAVNTHPFFDEYTTVLAARQILRHGWPILPSGLFYEHGLLATYLIAPFVALFVNMPLLEWQPAHWGLMLARWPSVMFGTATIPLIYVLGRHSFKTWAPRSPFPTALALLATGLFALSPEGMVWGGRARMYALATTLVLLTVYWAYQGSIHPAPAKYRRRALLALLAALLTQFGTMMLIPPLLMAMLIIGWLSWRETTHISPAPRSPLPAPRSPLPAPRSPLLAPRSPLLAPRPWFLRPTVLLEGAALAAIIGLAIFIKRLGRPLGAATLAHSPDGGNLLVDIFDKTIAYQTTFHFTWPDTVAFLARQFGVPHHFWLTLITLVGTTVGLIYWLIGHFRNKKANRSELWPVPLFNLFLWLVFGGMIGLMVTLLEPFRRNPRYLIMYLPLFYLIAANAVFNFRFILPLTSSFISRTPRSSLSALRSPLPVFLSLALLITFTLIGFNDWRIALLTPEPAYEAAFAHIRTEWQPGDALLTMNTPAAELYFGRADGFTVQLDADQFLLDAKTAPVDRWLGVPWIGRVDDLNTILNSNRRTWFVIDTIRQPVYFKGNWLAIVNSQMEQVWAQDNALIYRTRPDRIPIPTQPERLVNATLGGSIQLVGYALDRANAQAQTSKLTSKVSLSTSDEAKLQLTLFWQPLQPLATDYTTFLHLRDEAGVTVAQRDGQPLDGAYPTSQWQPGETVIDPITFVLPADLPAGSYTLYTGLYRLDTLERLPVAGDSTGENAILLGDIVLP